MRLSVGTNFDPELIEGLAGTDTKVVYGKLAKDIFGGGRPSMSLPDITKEQLKAHIDLAHQNGLQFNYLLNTNCMDNREFQTEVNREIFDTIRWLDEIGVDWITVSLPYLVRVVRQTAPRIRISLSTFAYVDTLQKAMEFEKLGVDEITLPEGLNRNFKLLRLFKENLSCDIQLIATNLCMAACPYRNYHANSQSHASQVNHESGGASIDFCMLSCTARTLSDPAEFIKIPWIRPEDLDVYEKIGIDSIKITERMKKTERLAEIAYAYTNRAYEGDLNRLLNFRIKSDFIEPNHDLLLGSDKYNTSYLLKSRELLFKRDIRIDNSRLDGFIDYFVKKETDCRNQLCGKTCRHCYEYANKAVVSDWDEPKEISEEIQTFLTEISSGALFQDQSGETLLWSQPLLIKLEAFLQKKPAFIRETARKMIVKEVEELAKKDGRKVVRLQDLLKANYDNTPKEFRHHLLKEMQENGVKAD